MATHIKPARSQQVTPPPPRDVQHIQPSPVDRFRRESASKQRRSIDDAAAAAAAAAGTVRSPLHRRGEEKKHAHTHARGLRWAANTNTHARDEEGGRGGGGEKMRK